MKNYLVLGDEGTVVGINGINYAAGTVVELSEDENSVQIALSDGQIEATDAEVTPVDGDDTEGDDTKEGE